jgi:hypothetical protein
MLHHLFRHSASTQNQGRVSFQISEDSLGKLHSGKRNRHGTRANLSFRSDAFPNFDRALKNSVQNGAGGALIERLSVGRAELAQDFSFAKHHRIDPRGNAIQMAHRVGACPPVQSPVQVPSLNLVEIRKKLLHGVRKAFAYFAGDSIELTAIARGKDNGLFENARAPKLIDR